MAFSKVMSGTQKCGKLSGGRDRFGGGKTFDRQRRERFAGGLEDCVPASQFLIAANDRVAVDLVDFDHDHSPWPTLAKEIFPASHLPSGELGR